MTIAIVDHATLAQRIAELQGGGGGGTTIHSALTAGSLIWTASGHTGTASRVAAFGGGGAAAYLEVGADLQAYSATLAAIAAGTWTGAASITTVGTIATGTWQGTAIASAYIGSHTHAASDITSGTIVAARLGTTSTAATKWQVLCADGVYRVRGGPAVANVTRTSDTTLSTSGLTMTSLPVGTYTLQMFGVHTGNATGGLKIQIVVTNGTCRYRAVDRDGGTTMQTESTTPNYSVSAGEQGLDISGHVNITSAGGAVDLHVAQNSSNATPTVIVRMTMQLLECS